MAIVFHANAALHANPNSRESLHVAIPTADGPREERVSFYGGKAEVESGVADFLVDKGYAVRSFELSTGGLADQAAADELLANALDCGVLVRDGRKFMLGAESMGDSAKKVTEKIGTDPEFKRQLLDLVAEKRAELAALTAQ